jgi:branched-chain amino acid transport system substrate-binding protein
LIIRRSPVSKKCIVLSLAVCFVAALLFSPVYGQEAAKSGQQMKVARIGVISPLSGPLTFTGTSILRCVQMAVAQINEKGTLGNNGPGILVGGQRYKIEVVNYDDSADPAKSVAGMRKLVELYKVPVILGPFGTPQVWACQEVNQGLKVLFNGLSTADGSRKKGNALYIQERVPGLYFGDYMAEAAIAKGYKKAAVVTDVNEAFLTWGKRFGQKFESLGGKVVGFESVDIKHTTDYHSIMTSFKAKGPDIIFIATYEEQSALACNHALDVGYKGKFMFGSDWGVKSEKIVGLDRIQGSILQAMMHTYLRMHPDKDTRGYATAFMKKYKEAYKEDFAQPGLSAYDPTWMFIRAMELSGSVTDAQAIRAACPKALKEGKLPLIFPNTDVLKNGLMVGTPELVLEVKGNTYELLKEIHVPTNILE